MSRRGKKQKSTKKVKSLIVLCLLIIAALGVYFGLKLTGKDKKVAEVVAEVKETIQTPEEPAKKIQIYSGTDRPVACMIDNHSDAWPQFSINDAYAVYEIIVEGGETRLMAIFKGKDVNQVGPMRSSRHYFLDYALENDAIYAHIGWSPQAQSDIKTLGVNNINGLEYDTGKAYKEGDVFWRITRKAAPHNSIASIPAIKKAAESKGYRITSDKKSVLNYTTDEISFAERTDGLPATDVTIPFSTLQSVNFKYDSQTQRYTRYARKKLQTDATTEQSITTKNIIITYAENYTLTDAENKGRQGLKNIGTKNGYYITNGMAIPITCTKDSRAGQTVYKDSTGKEIDVNDGNTFFEICPTDANVVIQ